MHEGCLWGHWWLWKNMTGWVGGFKGHRTVQILNWGPRIVD